MVQFVRRFISAIAVGLFVFVPVICQAQAAIWRNDWTVQKAPSLQYSDVEDAIAQSPMVASPDGEIIMRAASLNLDDQIVRFSTTGEVRWRVNIGMAGTNLARDGAMLGNADGSAYASAQYGLAVIRIDADGRIAWSEPFEAKFLAATPQAAIAQGCDAVTAFDASTGQLLWQHALPAGSGCAAAGPVTDISGATFVSFSIPVNGGYETHLQKFDEGGVLIWETHVTLSGTQRVVGTSGTLVYVADNTGVHALRTSDGSVQWNVSGASFLALGGIPAELIVGSAAGMQRLNAADGSARWTQPQTLPETGLRPMFCSAGDKAVFVTSQLDLATGAIDWTVTLPTSDSYGNGLSYFFARCGIDGTTTFAALPYTLAANVEPNVAPFLQQLDGAGNLLAPVPILAGAQGIQGESIVVDTHTIAALATEYGPTGSTTARVRGVDRNDGTTLWESVVAPPYFYTGNSHPYGGLGANEGTVAVSLAAEYVDYRSPASGVWVAALDAATGALRWGKKLFLVGTQYKYQLGTVSFDPLVDTQGNVIVSYATIVNEYAAGSISNHSQLSVVKLSAMDGSILWQHDEYFPTVVQYDVWAPSIFLLGSDVLVGGPFTAPNDTASLLKLSGVDGSVVWSSNALFAGGEDGSIGNVERTDDGNLVVFGAGWAKVDAQNGATVWTNQNDLQCVDICVNGGGAVVLPGGDVLTAGENEARAQLVLFPAHANATPIRWIFDQDDWHLRQSFAYTLNRDTNGNIWTRVLRIYSYYGQRVAYLARFDPDSGMLVSQQALYANNTDPLLPWLSPVPLTAPENNRLLVSTYSNGPPAPETTGDALIDTSVGANGNLSVALSAESTAPSQRVGFHLTVHYSGDAPIVGGRVVLNFPWTGQASDISCVTQSAANCVADPHAGTLVASFDAQPGGSIHLAGLIRTDVQGFTVPLSALVVGPTALNELNTSDNMAWATVEPSIFFDGFE